MRRAGGERMSEVGLLLNRGQHGVALVVVRIVVIESLRLSGDTAFLLGSRGEDELLAQLSGMEGGGTRRRRTEKRR